jgi:hypothetical protein
MKNSYNCIDEIDKHFNFKLEKMSLHNNINDNKENHNAMLKNDSKINTNKQLNENDNKDDQNVLSTRCSII